MQRTGLAKTSEILAGGIMIVAGLFFLSLSAYFTSSANFSWAPMFIILVVSISAIEAGAHRIKRYRALKKEVALERPPSLSRSAATVGVWAGVAGDIIGAVVMIAFLLAVSWFLFKGTTFRFNTNFYILIFLLAVYFLVRSRIISLFTPLLERLKAQGRKNLVSYEITDNGVWLSFKGWPENKKRIFIRFDELTDVRVMDRYESMALEKYGIGPDVALGFESSREIVEYNMGKISRPNKLSWMVNKSGAKTLLLHGPDVLYLIGIQDPTGEDLLRAFEKRKKG